MGRFFHPTFIQDLFLYLYWTIVAALAAGIPARMCHLSQCDFLVVSADAVPTTARLFRVRTAKAAVWHHKNGSTVDLQVCGRKENG
jgi:hypothetical protein